jgi:GTPase
MVSMKSGFVSLIGRPNVGKSTLLNSLINKKLAITSDKVQTTRNIIQGIYNDEETQIVFVDTPGIHKPKYKLGNILNKKAYTMTADVDLVLLLVDASQGLGKGDLFIINKLKEEQITNVFLIINKIDLIKKDQLLSLIDAYQQIYDFKEIIPLSALTKDNLLELIKTIKKYLTDNNQYYDEKTLTNVSTKFIISELVREKVLMLTKEEIPHAVTCYTENFIEEEKLVHISVVIIVDRDSLKKIIIGKKGDMLKKIGSLARQDMEEYLGKKVYLETFVKTLNNWREKEQYLKELGLDELE